MGHYRGSTLCEPSAPHLILIRYPKRYKTNSTNPPQVIFRSSGTTRSHCFLWPGKLKSVKEPPLNVTTMKWLRKYSLRQGGSTNRNGIQLKGITTKLFGVSCYLESLSHRRGDTGMGDHWYRIWVAVYGGVRITVRDLIQSNKNVQPGGIVLYKGPLEDAGGLVIDCNFA
jgi:hypothetical protein